MRTNETLVSLIWFDGWLIGILCAVIHYTSSCTRTCCGADIKVAHGDAGMNQRPMTFSGSYHASARYGRHAGTGRSAPSLRLHGSRDGSPQQECKIKASNHMRKDDDASMQQ